MKSLDTLTGDALEQMIDYKVVDENGAGIGTLHSLWSDPATGVVEFLGVKTGWLFGHNHVVPAEKAELDDANSLVRLPYTEIFVKEAPTMSADAEISEVEEDEIFRYYGLPGRGAAPGASTGSSLDQTSPGSAMVQEEEEMDGSATYIGIPTKLATAPAKSISVTGSGDSIPNTYRLQKTARPVPRPVAANEPGQENVPGITGMLSPTNDDFINGGAAAITTGVGSGIRESEAEEEVNSVAGTTGGATASEPVLGSENHIDDTDETRALGEPVAHENIDPLSGEHGAHAVGTGAGAASMGAAGAAIGAAVGGPVGAVVGAIAGAIGGGLAGKGVAESINPTVEDAYWQANYTRAPYYEGGHDYTDYGPAYRVGYQGYGGSSVERKEFAAAEQDLERRYEQERGSSKLEWSKAKHAARDAWDRVKNRVGESNVPTNWPS